MVLAGPALFWLFLNNFELGLSRDWDLASPAVFMTSLAGVASRSALTGPSEARRRGLVVMVVLTAIQTVGWVAVNASVDRSVRRFESLLDFRFQSPRAAAIALEEMGWYRRTNGDYAGAGSAYAQCVVLDSTNARRWVLLANAGAAAGDTSTARAAFERAIHLGTADPEAYLNLGVLRYHAGDMDQGIRLVRDAIALDTTQTLSLYTLGRMYQDGVRDTLAALHWYTRVLRMDSSHAGARMRAAECRRSL